MKCLWLHSVRIYITIGLFFYYKKIKIVKAEKKPKNEPVLFLANHQNALLDALLIATTCGRFSYYLTRASVFNKPLISKLLKSLQMYPVYRVRDGWSKLTNNNPIFEDCIDLLNNKNAVAIFPEGSHNLKRTVRPLSKGFTRIVFDALDKYPELDLQMVPIGFNFENGSSYADSCAIYYGKSISANTFAQEDRNQATNELKEVVYNRICELTTHIKTEHYDESINKLIIAKADFLDPKAVNNCISSNFSNCQFEPKNGFPVLKSILKGLLMINLIVPYLIWKFVVLPKIDEEEFVGTFRFAVAITLVPIWLLTLTIIFSNTFGLTFGFSYLIGLLALAIVTVKA